MTARYCDVHEANGKKVLGVWHHPKEKHSEWLCDECYQGVLKFYFHFVKKKGPSWSQLTEPLRKAKKKIKEEDVVAFVKKVRKGGKK